MSIRGAFSRMVGDADGRGWSSASSPEKMTPMATLQSGWKWCSGCAGLVHDSRAGVCPQSMSHALVGDYEVAMSDSEADGVPGFRWCGRCSQMFWGPEEASSQCPGGSTHTSAESGHYAVPLLQADRQPSGWFRCVRCQSLFSGYNGVGGGCFDGAPHNAAETVQYAPRKVTPTKVVLGARLPKIRR